LKQLVIIRTSFAANVGADKDSDSDSGQPSMAMPSGQGLPWSASSPMQP
jgi:hypothetical protein